MSALQHSPAKIVRQLLVDTGECGEPAYLNGRYTGAAWPAFDGTEPPQPDNVVVAKTGTDIIVARTARRNLVIYYGVQLWLRAAVNDTGRQMIQELRRWAAEDIYRNVVTIDANQYMVLNFNRIGPVLELGYNVPNDKRFLYTLNFSAVIRPLN